MTLRYRPFAAAAILVAILVGLLALAACGDSDDEPSPTPAVTPTATAADTPPATPVSTPTAEPPTPASTPTSPPATYDPEIVYHGDRGSRQVALTFDMGGRVEPALDIMAFLLANDVRSTIFMTGAMADNPNTEAGREVLRIICANPGTFELANHSYHHPDFRDISAGEMAEELRTTEAAMAPHCDMDPQPLFRPPFGGVSQAVLNGVAAAGYPLVIMWDIDTIDWRPEADGGPTASDMVAKVVGNAQGGSIVLMHLGGYNTLDALPAMVSGLRDAGFELVTVGELLGIQP